MNKVFKIIGGPNDGAYLEIDTDEDAQSPRQETNDVCSLIFPPHTKLAHLDESVNFALLDGEDQRKLADCFGIDANIGTHDDSAKYPIYCHDHSRIKLSTRPFSDAWDSGEIGWAVVPSDTVEREFNGDRAEVDACVNGELHAFTQYLNGDVTGFTVLDNHNNEIDSCWGFYGTDPRDNGMQDHVEFENLVEINSPELPSSTEM